MRILFAATGEIALPTLDALNEAGLIAAVLTAPDRRGKRGKDLIPTPVKQRAAELGLDVLTPEHLGADARKEVKVFSPDTLVSFCYGKIFGPRFLSMFESTYNIHPSLLPKYRGCAPLRETILSADSEGAVSVQKIALGCDEGDIYSAVTFPLDGTETEESLSQRVSHIASGLALKVLSDPSSYPPHPQEGEVSWSRMTEKGEAELNVLMGIREIHAKIRAYYPWPKAYLKWNGEPLYLCGVHGSVFSQEECSPEEEPGTCVALDKHRGLKIALKDGYIYITRLQKPTKKELSAAEFVNGNRSLIGAVLQ
ncbi:MAG: methionyl-tRNA formyltransferase [Bullifex sp.]